MEYLVVKFERSRRVVINGNPFGLTNTLIQIEAGTHTVTLAPPADFSPATLAVVVVDTSALAPLTVTFNPAPAPAAPPAPASLAPAPPAPAPPARPAPASRAPRKPA
jgi:PEGA domain-containing protein